MALTPQDLGPKSIDLAIQMVEANIHGKSNLLSAYIPNTKQRFDSIRTFIDAESRLPAPLVLLRTPEGYEVAEGNHRIGAMLAAAGQRGVPGFFPSEVDAWVGDIDA